MAGVRQVAPELLADRRPGRGRVLTVVVPTDRKVPAAPRGVGAVAKRVWRDFWHSPVAAAVDRGADSYALQRWIEAVDEREGLMGQVRHNHLIPGSMGQEVLNPLFRRIDVLTREIEKAEERFGMTPLSRFRLQLNYADAGAATDRLDRINQRREREDRAVAVESPRVVDLDALG